MKNPPVKSIGQELLQRVYNQRIWGKIICHFDEDAEKEDINTRVQVSLITVKTLEADWNFIQGEETGASYKPYFFEFFADVNMSYTTEQEFLRKNNGKILRVYLRKTEPVPSENSIVLSGHLLTAASPIRRQGYYLEITKEDDIGKFVSNTLKWILKRKKKIPLLREGMKKIILNADKNPFARIDKEIQSFFQSPICGGSIYNVGQGNFVRFYMDSNESFLFDAGMTTHKDSNTKITTARAEIRGIQPQLIILSHWDIDHIIGIAEIDNDKIYEDTIWIAPNPLLLGDEKTSFSAARLCLYLLRKNRISLLHQGKNANPLNADETTSSGGKVTKYCQNNFELFQGNGKDDSNGRRNNIGLILRIRLKDSLNYNALFAGDCSFEQMPEELKDGCYAFLLTAHHGSKNALPNDVYSDGNGLAVISYGKNSHGHPDKEHTNALKKNRFLDDCWETKDAIRIDFYFDRDYILASRIQNWEDTWWTTKYTKGTILFPINFQMNRTLYNPKLWRLQWNPNLWILHFDSKLWMILWEKSQKPPTHLT